MLIRPEKGNTMEWHDQVAVVTGGARGLGRATARLLAQRGAAVCVNYTNHCIAGPKEDLSRCSEGIPMPEVAYCPSRRSVLLFRGRLKRGKTMRKFFLMCAVLIAAPLTAIAGPKEEAFQVVEQFKAAFDASDVQGVVKLFAPDAVFLGTISPKIITTTADVDQYFQGLKQFMPRQINIQEHSTMVLSDRAVLFAGFQLDRRHLISGTVNQRVRQPYREGLRQRGDRGLVEP